MYHIRALDFLDFIQCDDDDIILTRMARTFLRKNPTKTYEPTRSQLLQLVNYLLFARKPVGKLMDEVVREVSFNSRECRYERQFPRRGVSRTDLYFRLFLSSAGFSKVDGDNIAYIDPLYNDLIRKKIRIMRWAEWTEREPTKQDLEKSEHAEDLIAEDEVKRLRELGRKDLADLVEVVGTYDATMGFDILSFEGRNSVPDRHDRFIEVKSSEADRLRFFLTFNEMRKARKLRERYFIHFVGNHRKERSLNDCRLEVIRDPARALFNTSRFELDAKKFYVKGVDQKA